MRILFTLLIILASTAYGQVYKWTDENGNVHFGTQPPPGQQEEVTIRDSSPGDMGAGRTQARAVENESADAKQNDPVANARRAANQRACDLAETELQSAERLLTLAQSQDSYDFVLDRRQKKVAHWQGRVDLHCVDPG
ncbi:hypothetical protein MARINON1_52488 [Marinobacter salarius]|uniref:DUF4124 domain-containing protein n=1 Tax=Marinobacter salarius TaxID=1420917 RepID=UPI0012594597|nr:DUF4124 domain-containing protein [Marinobacter salarius]VVT02741.1 conserved hypothetical protein [Marinobacter salarius]VXC25360.1 hypothetical protein MARINON1_52488 [Marinobacter salarius]